MSGNTKPSDPRNAAAPQASYQPHDRIQVQPGMPFSPYAGLGQPLYPHAFPVSGGRSRRQSRWRELGILLGLWMLVLLAAVAIGVRVLDLSAGVAGPDDYARATASPSPHAGPAALAASGPAADDDPFDDPLPVLPPVAPTTAATAVAVQGTSTVLTAPGTRQPATTAVARVVAPDAPAARPASPVEMASGACAPALSAMQLCGERVK